jgi:spermidine synthase
MATLVELWDTYGRSRYITDKGDGHSYLPIYDELFSKFKHEKCNILEIGHSAGGALRLFDDYFTHPETRIIGIDESDNDWLTMYHGIPYETDRVKTHIQDVHKLTIKWFEDLDFIPDIIIEDSNHQLSTQLFVVQNLLDIINPGGILAIEDVLDPQERRLEFEKTGIPFEVYDLNPIMYTRDNAIIVYRK